MSGGLWLRSISLVSALRCCGRSIGGPSVVDEAMRPTGLIPQAECDPQCPGRGTINDLRWTRLPSTRIEDIRHEHPHDGILVSNLDGIAGSDVRNREGGDFQVAVAVDQLFAGVVDLVVNRQALQFGKGLAETATSPRQPALARSHFTGTPRTRKRCSVSCASGSSANAWLKCRSRATGANGCEITGS